MKTQELINYPQDKNTTSVAIKEIYSVINSVSESCLGISSRSIKSNKLHANSILRLNDQFILFLNEIENNDKAYSLIPFIRFLSKCNKDGKFDHSTFDNYKRVKEKFSELIPSFGDYKKYFAEKYCSSLEITDQDSYSIRLFKTIVNRDEVAINEVLCSSQIEPDHASDIMLFLALDALNCEDYDLFKFALSKLSGRDLTKAFRLSIFDSICSELKVLKLFSPITPVELDGEQKETLTNQILIYDATTAKMEKLEQLGFNIPIVQVILLHRPLTENIDFISKYMKDLNYCKQSYISTLNDSNLNTTELELKNIFDSYKSSLERKNIALKLFFAKLIHFQDLSIVNKNQIEYGHTRIKFETVLCEDMIYYAKYFHIASNWHKNMFVCKWLDANTSHLPKELWQYIGQYLANMVAKGIYRPKHIKSEEQKSENSGDDSDYIYEGTESSSEMSIMSLEEEWFDEGDSSEDSTVDIAGDV